MTVYQKENSIVREFDIRYVDETLLKAGYRKHKDGISYVRDLFNKKRFHIYPHKMGFEIHLDRTIKKKHRTAKWWDMLHHELKRIRKVWRLNPEYITQHEARIAKNKKGKMSKIEYAPNIMELQKQASFLNH